MTHFGRFDFFRLAILTDLVLVRDEGAMLNTNYLQGMD